MSFHSTLLIIFFTLCLQKASLAETINHSLKTDARAKIAAYHPNHIYEVKTHYLVSTDIIFGKDEMLSVEDCHLGDASSWDIQTHKNHLYIKAKKLDAGGNLHVTTNKYTYHF